MQKVKLYYIVLVYLHCCIIKNPQKRLTTVWNSLPNPCPLPDNFDGIVKAAIANKKIMGDMKVRLIRQAGKYYYRLCPQPTSQE